MKSLVLIVGAGASKEARLPVGSEIKRRVAELLDIQYEHGLRLKKGDRQIAEAIHKPVPGGDKPDPQALQRLCWRIRDAMPQAISIDNFIDCHAGDPRLAHCGKLGIAKAILEAEARSSLYIDPSNIYNKLNFVANEGTWFNAFFQLLTENCRPSHLPERLQSVGVITFNYDRCIEHFLFHAFQNYYGVKPDEASTLLAHLEIHHAYGQVGSLPPASGQWTVPFGGDVNVAALISLSAQLRTFTESTDPSTSAIIGIRELVASARRLLFLGFAFHPLNLELLTPRSEKPVLTSEQIFGTALGISASDVHAIQADLTTRITVSGNIHLHNNATCAGLLHEHRRSLSLL